MAYKAIHRFAKISPQKARLVANLVRGKFADEALEILRFQPQRGARMLEKVIRSAMANAAEAGEMEPEGLYIRDVRVDEGPRFKRLRPRSRGMANIILKRMSHISVELE
ncbi:MAG: 50S ribosomal protein L22 [Planctomycetota bacterium]|nr:MAG: 50S ribosomal protein L22 [Planctomycetota bacterium]